MRLGKRILLALLFTSLMLSFSGKPVAATSSPLKIPPEFKALNIAQGVSLYRKDYENGTPDYVQVINLREGGALELLHGPINQPRLGKGVYGGDDPRLNYMALNDFWRQATKGGKEPFCVTNGSFFYMKENPTRLAFPLKVNGKVLTDGFGYRQYPDEEKLILELFADRVNIVPFSKSALYGSRAPDLITGLTEQANKRAKFSVGRTFIGILDGDEDQIYESALILNTSTSLQRDVAEVLRSFGAEKVMMLDGGGSTQLKCNGIDYIKSDRLIPQAIAIHAAQPAPVSATPLHPVMWLVVTEAELLHFSLNLVNTGVEAWIPGEHTFVLESSSLGAKTVFDFDRAVAPGKRTSLQTNLMGYSKSGFFSTSLDWHITRKGRIFPGEPIQLRVVVLPPEQVELRNEIQQKLASWKGKPDEEIENSLKELISGENDINVTHVDGVTEMVNLKNIVLVPVLMVPFLFLVYRIIRRIRQA